MASYSRTVQIPGKSSQELYDTISNGIESFLTKSSLGKFDIKRNDGSKSIEVKGSLFSATLMCQEEAMVLNAKLSLMATPFKSKIDDGLSKWLSKAFNVKTTLT
jgi:hypothetical protein